MDDPLAAEQAVKVKLSLPTYDFYMLPLLELAADGKIRDMQTAYQSLALKLELSAQVMRELLPSGKQTVYHNRVGWAKTYLTKAGLLESPKRGQFQITDRGYEVLSQKPLHLDKVYLRRFPEFREFHSRGDASEQGELQVKSSSDDEQTPEERLNQSFQQLRSSLQEEILSTVKQCSAEFFEQLVVDLLVAMGYGGSRKDAGRRIGQSGDGGVDGVIKEDRLGLDVIYIQAKRWESIVGRPVVQAFAGSLEGFRARKGVLITTSDFSQQAREYVERIEKKIILVDGQQLAELMIDYNVGVSEVAQYVIKRIDSDYFET